MKKSFKKIIAGLAVVGTFVIYAVSQNNTNVYKSSGQNNQNSLSTNTLPTNTAPVKTVKKVIPVVVTKTVPKGAFVDGTYTGNVADAYYGNVQVQAVVKNGQLADVVFLQYPNDRNTSIRINTMAMPQLRSEAISVQSANVDAVSGASETSRAFVDSLSSALTQAKS